MKRFISILLITTIVFSYVPTQKSYATDPVTTGLTIDILVAWILATSSGAITGWLLEDGFNAPDIDTKDELKAALKAQYTMKFIGLVFYLTNKLNPSIVHTKTILQSDIDTMKSYIQTEYAENLKLKIDNYYSGLTTLTGIEKEFADWKLLNLRWVGQFDSSGAIVSTTNLYEFKKNGTWTRCSQKEAYSFTPTTYQSLLLEYWNSSNSFISSVTATNINNNKYLYTTSSATSLWDHPTKASLTYILIYRDNSSLNGNISGSVTYQTMDPTAANAPKSANLISDAYYSIYSYLGDGKTRIQYTRNSSGVITGDYTQYPYSTGQYHYINAVPKSLVQILYCNFTALDVNGAIVLSPTTVNTPTNFKPFVFVPEVDSFGNIEIDNVFDVPIATGEDGIPYVPDIIDIPALTAEDMVPDVVVDPSLNILEQIRDAILSIPDRIGHEFTIDWTHVNGAIISSNGYANFSEKFAPFNSIIMTFTNLPQSFEEIDPIVWMDTPQFLIDIGVPERLKVFDLTPFKTYLYFARSIMSAFIYYSIAMFVVTELRVRFHVA